MRPGAWSRTATTSCVGARLEVRLRDVERSTIVRVSVVLAGVVLLVSGAVEDGPIDGSDLR